MTTFKTTIVNIFVAIILSSCASFPANKIKLSDYPEIKQEEVKKLDLSYKNTNLWNPDDLKNGQVFNGVINDQMRLNNIKKYEDNNKTSCVVKISSATSNDLLTCPIITNVISFFTLFIIPYYCQETFHIKATLIANNPEPTNNSTNQSKPDSANHQTNNTTSPNQTQPKILKEYYFKDKAHEVWSILIPFLLFNDTIWDAQTEKGWGSTIAEQNISQSLTRQIINDASKFSECQKQPNQNTTPTTKTNNQPKSPKPIK